MFQRFTGADADPRERLSKSDVPRVLADLLNGVQVHINNESLVLYAI